MSEGSTSGYDGLSGYDSASGHDSSPEQASLGYDGGPPRRHVDRAAQFMPFAALTGYYDLVRQRAEEADRTNWDELGPLELGPLDSELPEPEDTEPEPADPPKPAPAASRPHNPPRPAQSS